MRVNKDGKVSQRFSTASKIKQDVLKSVDLCMMNESLNLAKHFHFFLDICRHLVADVKGVYFVHIIMNCVNKIDIYIYKET